MRVKGSETKRKKSRPPLQPLLLSPNRNLNARASMIRKRTIVILKKTKTRNLTKKR